MTKYFLRIPLLLISVSLIISGVRWMISDEPWILDQIANEERLNMTFDELFSSEKNKTLS